jgi:hypothetical protein
MEYASSFQFKVTGIMKYMVYLLHRQGSITFQRFNRHLVLHQAGFKHFFKRLLQIGFNVINMLRAG